MRQPFFSFLDDLVELVGKWINKYILCVHPYGGSMVTELVMFN